MFAFPQPPNQNHPEPSKIPIVDIPDSAVVIDTILRLIYPGVEPPKITDMQTTVTLLITADKYNITSIYPTLKESMKSFLPEYSFMVYVLACRFGLLEEAKEAARVSTLSSILKMDHSDTVQHISGTDVYRFVCFVGQREKEGLLGIEDTLGWSNLPQKFLCSHWKSSKGFYDGLKKAAQDAFIKNPCLQLKDLFKVLDAVPDPPAGCGPYLNSADWYGDEGYECYDRYMDVFSCPLMPMTVRENLKRAILSLEELNCKLLEEAFPKEVGSG